MAIYLQNRPGNRGVDHPVLVVDFRLAEACFGLGDLSAGQFHFFRQWTASKRFVMLFQAIHLIAEVVYPVFA